jgi:hypothetical protein
MCAFGMVSCAPSAWCHVPLRHGGMGAFGPICTPSHRRTAARSDSGTHVRRPRRSTRAVAHAKARQHQARVASGRGCARDLIFRGVFRELPPIETILLAVPAAAGESAPRTKGIFTQSSEPLCR